MRKPDYFTPQTQVYDCTTCASKIQVLVRLGKGGKKSGQCTIQVRVVNPSKELIEIAKEQEMERLDKVINEEVNQADIP